MCLALLFSTFVSSFGEESSESTKPAIAVPFHSSSFRKRRRTIGRTMPNVSQPTGQDWDAVNVGRGASSRAKAPKTAREISLMKATGKLATEKR